MLAVALWVAIVIAVAVLVFSIAAATLGRELNEFSRHESLGFIRLTLAGLFAIVATQAISALGLKWYWITLIVGGAMLILLFGSQLLAKATAQRKFGNFIAKLLKPLIKSIDIAFSPIATKSAEEAEEYEQELIESVEDFGQTVVREIMVPRIDMVSVSGDASLELALKEFMNSGYSRLPVRGKNIDDVVGVLYLKDVARAFYKDPASLEMQSSSTLARKPIFVPDSKPVDDLLKEMQLSATHVAVIIDEYGGVAGLATMEDVIEELVGEINDEYDNERPEIEQLSLDTLRVSAKSSLFELGEHLGIELQDEDIDSVGGLVAKLLGRLPRGGDRVHHSGLTFTTERFEGRDKRLVSVLVKIDQDVLALRNE